MTINEDEGTCLTFFVMKSKNSHCNKVSSVNYDEHHYRKNGIILNFKRSHESSRAVLHVYVHRKGHQG